MDHEVIVIGAGLAGMVASLAAHAEGARVLLVDRGPIGIGTNSAMSNGVFSGPTSRYSAAAYVEDTLRIGKDLGRRSMVELMAREAPSAFAFLRSLRVPLEEASDHYYVKPPETGTIPGLIMVKAVAHAVKKAEGIFCLPGFYVTELIKEGGRVCGVRGWDKTGRVLSCRDPSVIVAGGGAGAVYLRNDNQKSIMGQGYALAAKAGLALWDMEFVQSYPIVLAEPRLPSMMLHSPHPEGTRLINERGEDLLQKHRINDLNTAIRKKRDEFSALLMEENAVSPVRIDYTRVPESCWDEHPLSLLKKLKFDFRSRPARILPAVHFFMGGVEIDEQCRTEVPGLFACGEMVWGLHGANRRGGNALTECLVLGRIAGRSAARNARLEPLPGSGGLKYEGSMATPVNPEATPEGFRLLRAIRHRLRAVAWDHAGLIRDRKGLEEGLELIGPLMEELRGIEPATVPDLKLKEDLRSAALILKAVLSASLVREESRGCFRRRDYPEQDDRRWRCHSGVLFDTETGAVTVDHRPSGDEMLSENTLHLSGD